MPPPLSNPADRQWDTMHAPSWTQPWIIQWEQYLPCPGRPIAFQGQKPRCCLEISAMFKQREGSELGIRGIVFEGKRITGEDIQHIAAPKVCGRTHAALSLARALPERHLAMVAHDDPPVRLQDFRPAHPCAEHV